MTLDELRERIKNELVLHEGNVADWQWNRTGLPAEAAELGVTDFLRLVDDVARSLNAQFGKILALQATIRKAATDAQKRLSDVQLGGFALDAERLGLSRSFVIEQWVPRILTQIPDPAPAEALSTPPPAPPEAETPAMPPAPATPAHGPKPLADIQQKVRDILDDYKEHIPAQAIRALFRAIDHDETALAEVVLTYLRDNFYASETEPKGNTLRDKLTSTDWRHLVWWERQTTPPPPAVQPALPVSPPAAPKSTGLRDMLFALLIAGGLIGFVIFLIKSGGKSPGASSPVTEQIDRRDAEAERTQTEERASRRAKNKRRSTPRQDESTQPETRAAERERTPSAPPSPREEPYDLLLTDVGQYGERPAKKDGQWGLWRKGRWMVLPVYDKIDVYKNGRARVTTNGNTYEIDQSGDRVRQ